MNLPALWKAGNVLTTRAIASLSRRAVLYAVSRQTSTLQARTELVHTMGSQACLGHRPLTEPKYFKNFEWNESENLSTFRSVGTTKGYGLDGRGSIPGRGKKFCSAPQLPGRLWGPPSLLFDGYRGLFPRG
jgi:hypothetical protein